MYALPDVAAVIVSADVTTKPEGLTPTRTIILPVKLTAAPPETNGPRVAYRLTLLVLN